MEKMVELMKSIWKESIIPQDWRNGRIVPLHKKGDKEKIENYRSISLLCTAYKIYAEILRKRLEKEVEIKEMLPESQSGFRRRRSTMDNIFILNHLIQKKKKKGEKEKIYMMFADLKAAFDKADRETLEDIEEERYQNTDSEKNRKSIRRDNNGSKDEARYNGKLLDESFLEEKESCKDA